MSSTGVQYAEVLLPLALENTYTYKVPEHLLDPLVIGQRVEVQFGSRKRYAGLVVRLTRQEPGYRTKEIISILDDQPILFDWQLEYWQWLSGYYCCTLGEVMKAALPGAMLLSSETVLSAMPVEEESLLQLENPLYDLMRLIQARPSVTLESLEDLSGLKVLYPHIVRLYQLGFILVVEELAEKYIPKKIKLVELAQEFASEDALNEVLDALSKHENQMRLLLGYLSITGLHRKPVLPKELLAKADVGPSTLKTLVQKGIFVEVLKEINRMDKYQSDEISTSSALTDDQVRAYKEIIKQWESKEVILLHGVTGSGKTMIYSHLIQDTIDKGGQVLYMVPEIGLSVQILNRLKKQFGKDITISHSRLSEQERVDLWHQVKKGVPVIAGVRSSIFLPFQNLRLIIVDEEHDSSYKQQDPAPRYHARDAAIYLAGKLKAQVLLGSATPSIDSYHHAETGKYGKSVLHERYQGVAMPQVMMIDMRKDKSSEGVVYSHSLIEEMKNTLAVKKQIIIFKNRRGYAPVLKCGVCQWVAECPNCDIALTFHKGRNKMQCHLCGTTRPIISICPACGSPRLLLEGYGTEKIEDELNLIFPEHVIRRMDMDTTRGKNNLENIIFSFENGKIDILVGTQMVTKGLDFDNVGLVGVIYADQALYYPDFRAAERTFQTLVQVSGRAGRKDHQGKVMIQTFQPEHPVFRDVVHHDFVSFYEREIKEREIFRYPPFIRQIAVTVRHRDAMLSREAAEILALELKEKFDKRILGPTVPNVGRVRNLFIHQIFIKMEKDTQLIKNVKQALKDFQNGIVKRKSLSTVRISIDVDPYH
jgi:primosomal protein N' (replication factor Y)